jgi:4-hydroxy-3-methylbut-2-en-1-yl diphosphate synthase IspG/GcpE
MLIGKKHPIVIQSLFPLINGEYPPDEEIEQYARRLLELKESGVQISYVQVHSARRPVTNPDCRHLPLKVLSI